MPEVIGRTCWVETVGPGYDQVPFVFWTPGMTCDWLGLVFVRDGRREYYGRVVVQARSEIKTPPPSGSAAKKRWPMTQAETRR